jgi:hypothetical protein
LLLRMSEGEALTHDCLTDHRTEVVGELLDTIDRIDPGLGETLMRAMFPTACDDPDFVFVEVPHGS